MSFECFEILQGKGMTKQDRVGLGAFSVAIIFALAIAVTGPSTSLAKRGRSQAAAEQSAAEVPIDPLQRSYRIDHYLEVANSGAGRGQNIYFFKCWMCHNKYAQAAPYLKDVYDRQSDDYIKEQIKNGGPGMPAFGKTLTDTDIADLSAYFKGGKCCVEGEELPTNPWYRADKQKWPVQTTLAGGARGIVHVANGDSPEGIGVQLIAPNAVRTTVYTNAEGHYEFPKMQAGSYTLRIPTPLIFKPFSRDSVRIDGDSKLDDIVLERVSKTDSLPPTPQISSQLSSAELLWNLSGTAEEKATFQKVCSPCHVWQQVLRNHYDERGWNIIVDRMTHYYSAPLAVRIKGSTVLGSTDDDNKIIVKWLSKVRGPDSQDAPYRVFPRPTGESTRVIITEFELPQALLTPHDVAGDSKGNIWFTSHKSLFVGKLDPRTGIVTEYKVDAVPGAMPGSHRISVDKNDIVWFSEPWAHILDRLDPQTGKITRVSIQVPQPLNVAGFSNFALAPDGFIWDNQDNQVRKIDPSTGKIVQQYPNQVKFSYDNMISADGNYWAGGGPPGYGNTAERLDIRTGKLTGLNTGVHFATAKRGGFDPFDNAWFGGGAGALVELNRKTDTIVEHWPPTAPSPFTDFYEAMPDKNGEVWAGILHGRQFVRFNPQTTHWSVYQMPEPYAYDRRTWIDNSTKPVTVWYVDYNGYLVRIQALE
jgi:streptogramin lyase/mono/diheme cytochrome c family protein